MHQLSKLVIEDFTLQWYSDGKEMYQNACCTCRVGLLIKPVIFSAFVPY